MKWSFIDETNGLVEGLNYGPLCYDPDGCWSKAEGLLIQGIAVWLASSADSIVSA